MLLAGLALLAALGWELPGSLSSSLLGTEGVDQYGTQWFYWFSADALSTGDFGRTQLFFYPWGKDIYAHTGANVLDALAAAPLLRALGPVAGYDVFVLLMLAVNGLVFAKLAREFTDDPVAIGISSIWFALCPVLLIEVDEGRPTQAVLAPLLLFTLYMWRSGTDRGWRAPLLAGLMLALTGLVYWFYAFFGGMMALAYGLTRAARPPEGAGGPLGVLSRHALIAAVALLAVAPFALPLAAQAVSDPTSVPGLLDVEQWSLSQVPPVTAEGFRVGVYTWQPFLGRSGFYMVDGQGGDRFNPVHQSFGWLEALLLTAGLAVAARGQRRALVAILVVSALLAFGPILVVGHSWYPNPFYIAVVKAVSFLRRLWWPGRAAILISVVVGICAALAMARLRARPALQGALGVGVLAALGWGHRERALLPFPTWSAEVPAGYRCLAEGPPGALIELPYAWTQAHVYYQTAHGRPILGGMIEDNPTFSPPEATAFRAENSFIAALLAFETQAEAADPARTGEPAEWTEADKQIAYDLGYRYVVLQKSAYGMLTSDNPMLRRVQDGHLMRSTRALQSLMGEPVWADKEIAIYAPWGDPPPCGR